VTSVEGGLLWFGIAGYAGALVLTLLAVALRRDRLRAGVAWAMAAGWLGHGATIVVRWVETGHAPVQGQYENSLAGAWFLPLVAFAISRAYRPAARALPFVLAATLLILGNGIMSPTDLEPLRPPFRSSWLAVHVTFAWLAFGCYVVATGLFGQHLWITRGGRTPERAPAVDEAAGRLVGVGFLGETVMIASGAIWAHGLWGRYWGWDPVETWSLVSWLSYAVYLHLRHTLGWTGRRSAWVGVAAAAGILFAFFGIGHVVDVHTQLL
jgi:ABC-type transport system involved in cytochrome c biogenesis permease subunit